MLYRDKFVCKETTLKPEKNINAKVGAKSLMTTEQWIVKSAIKKNNNNNNNYTGINKDLDLPAGDISKILDNRKFAISPAE